LAWERESKVRQILPLWLSKCELSGPKVAKIGNYWYKFAP